MLRQMTLLVFSTMAVPGQQPAPKLAELLAQLHEARDADQVRLAATALAKIGAPAAEATPDLCARLRAVDLTDEGSAQALFAALAALAPFAQDGAKQTRAALDDRTDLLHRYAVPFVRTYSRVELDPALPVLALRQKLDDQNPYVREFAAERLGALGQEAQAAVEDLAQRMTAAPGGFQVQGRNWRHYAGNGRYPDGDAAAVALAEIAPNDPRSVRGHALLLEDPDPMVRLASLTSLGALGTDAASALDVMRRRLHDPSPLVARQAITALGMLGDAAKAAEAELEALAAGDDKQAAACARAALKQIRG